MKRVPSRSGCAGHLEQIAHLHAGHPGRGAAAGALDVTVTNPDGQSGTFTNIFMVRRDTSATTTTSSVSSVPFLSPLFDPPLCYPMTTGNIRIMGSKFQTGAAVTLQKEGKTDIVGTTVRVMSDTRIQCFFDIPYESTGNWDIVVTNPDNTFGKGWLAVWKSEDNKKPVFSALENSFGIH